MIAVVDAQDRLARRVDVDVASHHPIVDPILEDLRTRAGRAEARPARRSRSSSPPTNAPPTAPTSSTPTHWVANLRNPVRFARAVATAGADKAIFVEVSPHPLLGYAIKDTLADTHHHNLATLTRDANDTLTFHTNLNATHTVRPPKLPHRGGPRLQFPQRPGITRITGSRHSSQPEPLQHNGVTVQSGTPPGRRTSGSTSSRWPVRELGQSEVDGLLAGAGRRAGCRPGSPSCWDRIRARCPWRCSTTRRHWRAALSAADVAHVVYAPPSPTGHLDAGASYRAFNQLRRLVVALAATAPAPRLLVATRNAQPVVRRRPRQPRARRAVGSWSHACARASRVLGRGRRCRRHGAAGTAGAVPAGRGALVHGDRRHRPRRPGRLPERCAPRAATGARARCPRCR